MVKVGLFDRFKSKEKWESDDPKIKLEGIKELQDEEKLKHIFYAEEDNNRLAVIKNPYLVDEKFLTEIAIRGKGYSSRGTNYIHARAAMDKINTISYLEEIAKNANDKAIKSLAETKIKNIPIIARLNRNYPKFDQEDLNTQTSIVEKMNDEEILIYLLKNHDNELVREAAAKNTSLKDNETFLSTILLDDSSKVKYACLTNPNYTNEDDSLDRGYAITVLKDKDRNNRKYALERLNDEDTIRIVIDKEKDDELLEIAKNKLNLLKEARGATESINEYPDLLNEDVNVRLKAIDDVPNESVLMEVVKNDDNLDVRLKAIGKINNSYLIGEVVKIAENENDRHVRRQILKQLDDNVLLNLASRTSNNELKDDALDCVTQESLVKYIKNIYDNNLRYKACEKIRDKKVLIELAKNPDKDIYNAAFYSINDYDTLYKLATDQDSTIRTRTFFNISHKRIVKQFIKSSDKEINYPAFKHYTIKDRNDAVDIANGAKDDRIKKEAIEYINLIDQNHMTRIKYYCSNCNKIVYKNARSCPYCKVTLKGEKIIRR